MNSVSPVWTEKEVEAEHVIALDQPQYEPIILLPFKYSDGTIAGSVRFRLSDEERKTIADGGDLIVTELTFGGPFTPLHLAVRMPDEGLERA
jgi:hypothetical protein